MWKSVVEAKRDRSDIERDRILEAGQYWKRDRSAVLSIGSGTGPILLSQATFVLAHIANSGPVPLSRFPLSRFGLIVHQLIP